MADGNSTSSVVIQWSTLLAVAAAVVGAVSRLTPLTSTRPADPVAGSRLSIGDQDVDARLWQDPFQATAADRESARPTGTVPSAPAEGHDPKGLASQIARAIAEGSRASATAPSLLVLPVMVEGEPYPDRAEQRVRARVAVVSGLTLRRFYPRDAEHVGYVRVNWDPRLQGRHAGAAPDNGQMAAHLVIPYEWFDGFPASGVTSSAGPVGPVPGTSMTDPSAVGFRRVLVLWLNESVMRDRPLARLASVLDAVLPPGKEPPSAWGGPQPFAVRVVGPRISQTLQALHAEMRALPYGASRAAARAAQFFAATPTVDDAVLDQPAPADPPVPEGPPAPPRPGDGRPQVSRTTLTDGGLCGALVAELERRAVDVSPSGRSHVAIVTELDTFYGRQLETSFRRAAVGAAATPSEWISSFRYLRGVDGRAAGDPKSSFKKDEDAADKSGRVDVARLVSPPAEQTEGASQADYLRRLASNLRAHDQALRRGGQRLRAVGVLGSDVYDKLLVLRALRKELPGCLFFTTGLDARYGLPAEWEATHNLIVAADYGLTLDPSHQGPVPPFRDSLQTSLFATTLAVVGRPWGQPVAAADLRPDTAPGDAPRLFEVGRDRFYDLSVPEPAGDGGRRVAGPAAGRLHPERADGSLLTGWQWTLWAWVIGVLLAGLAAGWLLGVRPAVVRWLRFFELGTPVFCVSLGVGTLAAAVLANASWPANEPLSLAGGVSVWPSVVIRFAAGMLAVSLVLKTWATGQQNNRAMADHFGLPVPGGSRQTGAEPADAMPARWRWRRGVRRRRRWLARRWRRWPRRDLGDWNRRLWWHARRWTARCRLWLGRSWCFVAACGGAAVARVRGRGQWRTWRRDWRRLAFGRWPVYFRPSAPHLPADADPGPELTREARISDSPRACGPAAKNVDATAIWREFLFRAGLAPRLVRTTLAAAAYLLLTALLVQVAGYPTTPARGTVARVANDASGWGAGVAAVVLLFFVLDGMYLNKRLIDNLGKQTTRWPGRTLDRFKRPGVRTRDLTEYVDIRFIAERTRVVGDAAYYPLPVFFLLIASRISLFDDWDWPAGLLVAYLACVALAILAALMLRWAAEGAREQALGLVGARVRREERAAAECRAGPDQDRHLARADALRALRQLIEREKEGAFSILSNYPLTAAVLLPSGGVGLWALLDQLPRLLS
jgi:hypothetical protein